MSLLYVSPNSPGGISRPSLTRLFHSILLTSLSIGIAVTIGVIQLLTLIYNVKEPTGPFWDGVQWLGDRYDIVGAVICGAFFVIGVGGVIIGKVVRDRRRRQRQREISDP
jgi:nickel/cobalt transporter (NiCoT) family protein